MKRSILCITALAMTCYMSSCKKDNKQADDLIIGNWDQTYRSYDANHDGVISDSERTSVKDMGMGMGFDKDGTTSFNEDRHSVHKGPYIHKGSKLIVDHEGLSDEWTVETLTATQLVITTIATDETGVRTLFEYDYTRSK